MGTTSRFGISYPELSAGPDGPSQMQTLANTVDTALGSAVDDVAGLTSGISDLLWNGCYQANQRELSSYTASASSGKYTFDGWYLYSGSGAANTVTVSAETAGAYPDHERYRADWNRTTAGSADSYYEHRVEDVRRASGATITVAILADVASSTADLKVEVVQNFGSGGSPSTAVVTTSTAISVTTSLTAQYVTIAVPSVGGKTLGSNNDHYIAVRLTRQSGYGTGTIRLHRVSAIMGSAHVFADKRPVAQVRAIAQRYYYQLGPYGAAANFGWARGVSTTGGIGYVVLPVTMRTTPTATFSANNDFSSNGVNTTAVAQSGESTPSLVTVALTFASGYAANAAASFDNAQDTTNAAIYVSAEL